MNHIRHENDAMNDYSADEVGVENVRTMKVSKSTQL